MHAASAVKGSCDLRQFGAAWCASPLCSLVQVGVSKISRSVKHSFLCREKKGNQKLRIAVKVQATFTTQDLFCWSTHFVVSLSNNYCEG